MKIGMFKTGVCFTIDGYCGELIERGDKLLRRYENGEEQYADDIDTAVIDAVYDDEFFYLDGMLSQIENDTCRIYSV